MSQQIAKSTVLNKTRLKVLESREDVLNDVFTDAGNKLSDITKDSAKYKKVLEGLIEEVSCYCSSVTIYCFADDRARVLLH